MNDSPTELRQVRIVVRGRVQGVAYRASARDAAHRAGLVGSVRNRSDGGVEIRALGPRADVERFIDWCRRGPPLARVTELTVDDEPPDPGRHRDFSIEY